MGGCNSRTSPQNVPCLFANGATGCCAKSQLTVCGPNWTTPKSQTCPGGPLYKCVIPGTDVNQIMNFGCSKTRGEITTIIRNLDDIPVMKYSRAARAFLQKYQVGPALADFIEESVETAPDFDKYDDGKSSF